MSRAVLLLCVLLVAVPAVLARHAFHARAADATLVRAHVDADPSELQYTITVNGTQRTYYMYVPSAYNKTTQPWPLMMFFHGASDACTAGANFMIDGFVTEQVAREFLLVAACGINKMWTGSTDLPFTEAIMDAVTSQYRIDSSRIYGSGFSNGAGLIEYMGCRIPNRFAGISYGAGTVSGDSYPSTDSNSVLLQNCDTLFAEAQTTVSVLKLQGAVDPVVLPYGQTGTPSMRDDFYGWALRNGCKGSPTTAVENSVYKDEHFENCPKGVTVRLVMLYGIPHQWVHNATFNYNTVILDNFNVVAPTTDVSSPQEYHTRVHARGHRSYSP